MARQTTDHAAPPVLGGLVAYVNVEGASKAAEFYEKAFGAKTVYSVPPDEKGRTMHVHAHVNGSSLMISDFYPEHGFGGSSRRRPSPCNSSSRRTRSTPGGSGRWMPAARSRCRWM